MAFLKISERNLSGKVACQWQFFKPNLDPGYISMDTPFKVCFFFKFPAWAAGKGAWMRVAGGVEIPVPPKLM
jgi:hypothetical protein